ncbi:MAG: hypothetical protein KDA79_23330 [Planctomycetaceae bacterium]|nr:hypothetical protein [Planctomycetaceae bacterium]
MLELEQQILNQHPEWRGVLERYVAEHDRSRKENPEHDGWVSRLTDHEELPPEILPRVHGRLIALGLIRFQIADRTAGMRYQVTGVGRAALRGMPDSDDDSGADETSEADDMS